MSNIITLPKQAIAQAEARFIKNAERTGVDWNAESLFAIQALKKNDYLRKIAETNPTSVTYAMFNVAAVGITLNPARKLAYLVPRDGEVLLDISYRGLIHIARQEGAISKAKAEIVCENDHFEYRGPFREPVHQFNPFSKERGDIVGVYCHAILPDGSSMVETMPIDEVWKIRDLSMAYARKKSGPWITFQEEMIKKTVIKRASKTWPDAPRLAEAIQYLDQVAGEGIIDAEGQEASPIIGEAEYEEVALEDNEIPENISEYVGRVIQRARATGLWQNARDLISERYAGPYRTWALKKIGEAEEAPASAANG